VREASTLIDALHTAMDRARGFTDESGVLGYGVAHLRDADGNTKLILPFHNLITDAGDAYIARKIAAGIGPAAGVAPTAANGMKLGTSQTSPAKNGSGAVLGGYLTGANVAFSASYPQVVSLGASLGTNVLYRGVFGAGVGTSQTIREIALVNDQSTNGPGTAATTYARALFTSTIPKDAGDSLTVDWAWKTLGTAG
jgi:hypothetical protein